METIYLSLRAQVVVGTFFMKSPVLKTTKVAIKSSFRQRIGHVILSSNISARGGGGSGLSIFFL